MTPSSPLSSSFSPPALTCSRKAGKGFTLVELVVTLIVIGILAAGVAPRFINRSGFDMSGFFDASASFLRYAQKSAVAQRRRVCVEFGADASITLKIASTFNASACDRDLSSPDGGAPYRLLPPPGVQFAQSANFAFLPSGGASSDQTIRIAGLGKPITVWAATGYVQAE